MSRSNILTNDTARDRFVQACLALKSESIPNSRYSYYDIFPIWHFQAMNTPTPAGQMARNAAHGGPSFGPWHRLMLIVFEFYANQVLGTNDFELPYWDWAQDANDPGASQVWNVVGGNGNASDGFAVVDGPFGTTQNEFDVRMTDGLGGQWIGINERPLRRQFNWDGWTTFDSRSDIRDDINDFPSYEAWPYNNSAASFRRQLEIPMHNMVHRFVGRDMMSSASPNDPVFFLHHANVDRIWAAWQDEYPNATWSPGDNASDALNFHRPSDLMHNYWNLQLTIEDMVNYTQFYTYDSLS